MLDECKMMNLHAYRNSPLEQERIKNLLRIVPYGFGSVLDIGARDGYISKLLSSRFTHVTALDLEMPAFDDPTIVKVKGDVTQLQFENESFDVVVCTEVLEHIPEPKLSKACWEISRVARFGVVVGVPYRQDIRVGRTTCQQCGSKNPPWGHVNSFDESRLCGLFEKFECEDVSFVGSTTEGTNSVSTQLMDYAGNPYGVYGQEEPCIHCGGTIGSSSPRSFLQKIATKVAFGLNRIHTTFIRPHAKWIHVRFVKQTV